jgi:hypothetical protein
MTAIAKTLYRPACAEDAPAVAELFSLAGHGIADYFWSLQAGEGQSPIEVGIERARREDAAFSWRNAFLAERGALRLYLRHGFRPVDRRPVVPHSCYPHRGDILLLVQNLN